MVSSNVRHICIIGGGFFGMYIAETLALRGHKVVLAEQENAFMKRASYVNQARVHNGYHYPRSILTALRSHISFPRFIAEFPQCIADNFEKYYMIGKRLGKITAAQYKRFCERVGIVCEPAPAKIERLCNPKFVEAAFLTQEYAFNGVILRDIMIDRLNSAKVESRLNTKVLKIEKRKDALFAISEKADNMQEEPYDHIFNCTYSQINYILSESSIEIVPLKHEMTEMALVEPPPEIKNLGITVMCGPFFSVMPFPPRELHSFSHVRYTPHYEWYDSGKNICFDSHKRFEHDEKHTAWEAIKRDAARYMPILSQCVYKDSLWEVKTVLPRSESDDSRPILFRKNHGMDGLHLVMGGKIDNVYDAVETIDKELDL